MQDKQLLWLGSLVAVGIMTASIPVSAQTNQSDVSGGQTFSAPSVSVDSFNGRGVPQTLSFDPATGIISGGGLENPIQFDSFFGNASGRGFGNFLGIDPSINTGFNNGASGTGSSINTDTANNSSGASSNGNGQADGGIANGESDNSGTANGSIVDCSSKSCLEVNDTQPREVTINEIAEALEKGLEQSLDNLAAAEKKVQLAKAGPRRIARRSAIGNRTCVNPVYQVREVIREQLNESKKFIEQVEQIEPQKNIW